jgi:hypothetical protein
MSLINYTELDENVPEMPFNELNENQKINRLLHDSCLPCGESDDEGFDEPGTNCKCDICIGYCAYNRIGDVSKKLMAAHIFRLLDEDEEVADILVEMIKKFGAATVDNKNNEPTVKEVFKPLKSKVREPRNSSKIREPKNSSKKRKHNK